MGISNSNSLITQRSLTKTSWRSLSTGKNMENFKLIPLGESGKFAIVDEEDYEWLSQWNWSLGDGYARRTIAEKNYSISKTGRKYKKTKTILMHRLINQTPEGFDTDHKNRNRLDNQRSNLRTATRFENAQNVGIRVTNTSGHTGVSWDKGKWVAKTSINKKRSVIGRFDTREEASEVYQTFISGTLEQQEAIKCSYKTSNRKLIGVHWNKKNQRWFAQGCKNKKRTHLGSFADKEDAIAARKNWESSQSSTEP